MRLIDADELIKKINEIYKGYMTDECGCTPCDFEEIVDEQPTAYDIDKVVKELYEERTEILLSNDYENEIINYCLDNFDRAIEIVEQGLKEQNK